MPTIPGPETIVGQRPDERQSLPRQSGGISPSAGQLQAPPTAGQNALKRSQAQLQEVALRRQAVVAQDFEVHLKTKATELLTAEQEKEGRQAMGGRERWDDGMNGYFDTLIDNDAFAGIDKNAAKRSLERIRSDAVSPLLKHENAELRKHGVAAAQANAAADLDELTRLEAFPDGSFDEKTTARIMGDLQSSYVQIMVSDDNNPLDPTSPEGRQWLETQMNAATAAMLKSQVSSAMAEENWELAENILNKAPGVLVPVEEAKMRKEIFVIKNTIEGHRQAENFYSSGGSWDDWKTFLKDNDDAPWKGPATNHYSYLTNGDRTQIERERNDFAYMQGQAVVDATQGIFHKMLQHPGITPADLIKMPEFSKYNSSPEMFDVFRRAFPLAQNLFKDPKKTGQTYAQLLDERGATLGVQTFRNEELDTEAKQIAYLNSLADDGIEEPTVVEKAVNYVKERHKAVDVASTARTDTSRVMLDAVPHAFNGQFHPSMVSAADMSDPAVTQQLEAIQHINAIAQGRVQFGEEGRAPATGDPRIVFTRKRLEASPTVQALWDHRAFRKMSYNDIRANIGQMPQLIARMHPMRQQAAIARVRNALSGATDPKTMSASVAEQVLTLPAMVEEHDWDKSSNKYAELRRDVMQSWNDWLNIPGNEQRATEITPDVYEEVQNMVLAKRDILTIPGWNNDLESLNDIGLLDLQSNNKLRVDLDYISQDDIDLWNAVITQERGLMVGPDERKILVEHYHALALLSSMSSAPITLRVNALNSLREKVGDDSMHLLRWIYSRTDPAPKPVYGAR